MIFQPVHEVVARSDEDALVVVLRSFDDLVVLAAEEKLAVAAEDAAGHVVQAHIVELQAGGRLDRHNRVGPVRLAAAHIDQLTPEPSSTVQSLSRKLHSGGVMPFMSLESFISVPAFALGTASASRARAASIALTAVRPIFIFLIRPEIKNSPSLAICFLGSLSLYLLESRAKAEQGCFFKPTP